MGRKSIYDQDRKRQRGSQAFTTCGFDDRVARPEFAHINLREFNQACYAFLLAREPGCAAMRERQYGRSMRGLKKKKSDQCAVSSDQGKKSSVRWWEGGDL